MRTIYARNDRVKPRSSSTKPQAQRHRSWTSGRFSAAQLAHRPARLIALAFFIAVAIALVLAFAAGSETTLLALSSGAMNNTVLNSSGTVQLAQSNPSGQAMPVGDIPGWHQIFTDDFIQPVALGQFPSAVSTKWDAYPYDWHDSTGGGTYWPEKGLSVHDGTMDIYLHTENGVHVNEAPMPKLPLPTGGVSINRTYGRYVARWKADAMPGYKTSWLLWPSDDVWPGHGEIDYPEAALDGRDTISAFMHRMNGTSGGDQDVYDSTTIEAGSGWHTTTIEWSSTHCKFFLDGVLLGDSTSRIPSTPMHFVFQSVNQIVSPSNSVAGHILVD